MTYPGGKAGPGVFQAIINEIPPHDTTIEPFLGDGTIIRRLRPAQRTVGVEIDRDVLAAFNGDAVPNLELYHGCGIAWLRHAFQLDRIPPPKPATPPGFQYSAAGNGVGRSRDAGNCDPAGRAAPLGVARASGRRPSQLPATLATDSQTSDPAGPILLAARVRAFVYADPPYPFEVRRNGAKLYKYEFTAEDHTELLATLKSLPCLAAVSCYFDEQYAAELCDWRMITFRGHSRQGPTTEYLWMNYPQPTELHDSRYVGRNKRERERIRRRARNWRRTLEKLPPLERQSILDTITGRTNQRPPRPSQNTAPPAEKAERIR